MNDSLVVRGFERLRDLCRDLQGLLEWDRASCQAVGEVFTLDQFHHERGYPPALFQAVDAGDVRMIQ